MIIEIGVDTSSSEKRLKELGDRLMGSCLRVASSHHDSHPFQASAKIKIAEYRVSQMVVANLL